MARIKKFPARPHPNWASVQMESQSESEEESEVVEEDARIEALAQHQVVLSHADFMYTPVKFRVFSRLSEDGDWVLSKFVGRAGSPKDVRDGVTFVLEWQQEHVKVKFTELNYGVEWVAVQAPGRRF